MPRTLAVALLGLGALAVAAGAQQRRLEGVSLDDDTIGWQQLRRDDFRGDHPPAAFAGTPVRPVAVSCTFLVPDPAARIVARPRRSGDGVVYRARVEGLTFRAMLSRRCSWWNREAEVSPAYVLQHEQIHFDIFEAAARRLNRDLPGRLAATTIEAAESDSAVARTQRRIEGLLRQALDAAGKRNLDFDRQTSYGFQPDRQAVWRARLDRDLTELRRYAAPAGDLPEGEEDEAAPSAKGRRLP